MTILVGMKTANSLIMGCDSGTFIGDTVVNFERPKVFVLKDRPFIMGVTGSPRINDLLRYVFEPPMLPLNVDTNEYIVKYFVPAYIDLLDKNGILKVKVAKAQPRARTEKQIEIK